MKLFLKIIAGALIGIVGGIFLTIAMNMMSTASSASVFIGFLLVVVFIAGAVVGLRGLYRKYFRRWHRQRDGSYRTFKGE